MDIAAAIREATHDLHRRLEELPFPQAMVTAQLSREEYGRALVQLLHLHRTLEQELQRHPALTCVYGPSMARERTLQRDMAALGLAGRGEPLSETECLLELFREWSRLSPWSLLGALYIYEGSRMGSMFLARPLAESLGVPMEAGHGLDYHLEGLDTRPQVWKQFKANLQAAPYSLEQKKDIIRAATRTMQALYDLYTALPEPTPNPVIPVASE
jgi:heme oxygenase